MKHKIGKGGLGQPVQVANSFLKPRRDDKAPRKRLRLEESEGHKSEVGKKMKEALEMIAKVNHIDFATMSEMEKPRRIDGYVTVSNRYGVSSALLREQFQARFQKKRRVAGEPDLEEKKAAEKDECAAGERVDIQATEQQDQEQFEIPEDTEERMERAFEELARLNNFDLSEDRDKEIPSRIFGYIPVSEKYGIPVMHLRSKFKKRFPCHNDPKVQEKMQFAIEEIAAMNNIDLLTLTEKSFPRRLGGILAISEKYGVSHSTLRRRIFNLTTTSNLMMDCKRIDTFLQSMILMGSTVCKAEIREIGEKLAREKDENAVFKPPSSWEQETLSRAWKPMKCAIGLNKIFVDQTWQDWLLRLRFAYRSANTSTGPRVFFLGSVDIALDSISKVGMSRPILFDPTSQYLEGPQITRAFLCFNTGGEFCGPIHFVVEKRIFDQLAPSVRTNCSEYVVHCSEFQQAFMSRTLFLEISKSLASTIGSLEPAVLVTEHRIGQLFGFESMEQFQNRQIFPLAIPKCASNKGNLHPFKSSIGSYHILNDVKKRFQNLSCKMNDITLFKNVLEETCTKAAIKAGFMSAGIWPIDEEQIRRAWLGEDSFFPDTAEVVDSKSDYYDQCESPLSMPSASVLNRSRILSTKIHL